MNSCSDPMDYQGLLWKINKSGFEKRITSEGSRQAKFGQKTKWRNKWKALMKVSLRCLGAELRICSKWEEICSPFSVKHVDLLKSTIRVGKSLVGRWSCFSYLSDILFLSSLPGELLLILQKPPWTIKRPPTVDLDFWLICDHLAIFT